jgi:hypothetical protein
MFFYLSSFTCSVPDPDPEDPKVIDLDPDPNLYDFVIKD